MAENMTAKNAMEQAKSEIQKENVEKGVKLYKQKLRALESAKIVVRNIEREIEELEHEIGNI